MILDGEVVVGLAADDDRVAEAGRGGEGDRRVLAVVVARAAGELDADDVADDAEVGSYQIGVLSPIGALDRQRLLTAPGPQQRLDLLEELLDDQELMLRARLDDL